MGKGRTKNCANSIYPGPVISYQRELDREIKRTVQGNGWALAILAHIDLLVSTNKVAHVISLGRDHELVLGAEAAIDTGDAQGLLLAGAQGHGAEVEAGDVEVGDDAGSEAVVCLGVGAGEGDGGVGPGSEGQSGDSDSREELHGGYMCV
jgi:hypothetical protein